MSIRSFLLGGLILFFISISFSIVKIMNNIYIIYLNKTRVGTFNKTSFGNVSYKHYQEERNG